MTTTANHSFEAFRAQVIEARRRAKVDYFADIDFEGRAMATLPALSRVQEETWEMFLADNPDPDLVDGYTTLAHKPNTVTGVEHMLDYLYHLGEDEFVEEDILAEQCKQDWLEGKALDGEYEEYLPSDHWWEEDEEEVVEASWAHHEDLGEFVEDGY